MRDRRYNALSREKRIQLLEARLRQHHVDVQRLWKRIPAGPVNYGQPLSSTPGADPFDPGTGPALTGVPFPGTGGTVAQTATCVSIQEYLVNRYGSDGWSQACGGSGTPAWESPRRAEGAPDVLFASALISQAAGGTIPDNNRQSQCLFLEEFGFSIPADATVYQIWAFVTWRYTNSTAPLSFGNGVLAVAPCLNGALDATTITVNLASVPNSGVITTTFGPWGPSGGTAIPGAYLNPTNIVSGGFGVRAHVSYKSQLTAANTLTVYVDSIQLRVVYRVTRPCTGGTP